MGWVDVPELWLQSDDQIAMSVDKSANLDKLANRIDCLGSAMRMN